MAHAHEHPLLSRTERKLWWAILLNGLIPAVEIVAGLWIGSLALIADALHNLTDLFALILSWVGQRALRWKPNAVKTYGYGRLEVTISVINALLLVGVAGYIIYRAVITLLSPPDLAGFSVTLVALVAFAANLASALLLRSEAKHSLNLRSAFLHLLLDAGQSLAVILAGLAIAFFGWTFLDPLLSLLIGVFIIWSAYGVLKEGLNILHEGAPSGLKLEEIERYLRQVPGVRDLHHLHIWSLSSGTAALSAHLVLDDQPVSAANEIAQSVNLGLQETFAIAHTTLQLECSDGSCPSPGCTNCR